MHLVARFKNAAKPPHVKPSLLEKGGAERRMMGRECEDCREATPIINRAKRVPMKPSFGGGCPEGAGDGTRMRKLSRSDTCFFVRIELRSFMRDESRGENPRRTPVVLHFLSFPGKKGNEAKERNRRQGKIRLYSGGAAARP